MGSWWKFFVIATILLAVGLVAGLFFGQSGLFIISTALLITLQIVAGISFAVSYKQSFSNAPLLKAELRIWRNWPKVILNLYTERDGIETEPEKIETEPEKIEISVDPNAEVVLLTVGTGRYFNDTDPHPVIVTVPSEEVKDKWHEKFDEAQRIIQERRKKSEEARKKAEKARKEDLLPKPDKIPTIRTPKKRC